LQAENKNIDGSTNPAPETASFFAQKMGEKNIFHFDDSFCFFSVR
jgi:hypothetical protein